MCSVPVHEIVTALQQANTVLVSGLIGSSRILMMVNLSRVRSPVVMLAKEDQLDRYYSELSQINADVVLIDQNNPFYRSARIVITTPEFLSAEVPEKERRRIVPHTQLDRDALLKQLESTGFTREDIVEDENEFALRGGILDLYPAGEAPVRIELYGNEIYSIRTLNTQTQRSIEEIPETSFYLISADSRKPVIDYLPQDAIAVSEEELILPLPRIILTARGGIHYDHAPAPCYFGDLKKLREAINSSALRYVFYVAYAAVAERLRSIFDTTEIRLLPLNEGFIDRQNGIAYLTEREIFGTVIQKKKKFKGLFVDDLLGLKEGDYVVHADYGIGQFQGLTLIDVDDRKVECLNIAYAGKDRVYLPVEKMNLLERYVATDERPPKLSKLGSEVWLRTKKRIKQATERLAIDLLKLYTVRYQEKGYAFSQDAQEMNELEVSFPYEETPDQSAAIAAAKQDMEKPKPAERLICGDVGYGKTEIALRAAFKAALDGKQTMILCPTTLLAFQHFTTFKKRLAPFPVNVEMLSRFRKRQESKKILDDLARGAIDIIIGTHRLLQPDVQFKDLALLIIDEEQRFGVIQKERIKNIKPGIDTFSLSATPIPRTLYMALTGLKEISTIHTPPPGRKDIRTKIIYFSEEEIANIILFELHRGGQVFFVHNRIQTIDTVHRKLAVLVPQARICVLHGQMREAITEKRMVAFIDGRYDVLLSTAIVESGLDMPHVNTIIVDNAHTFGLADLHQLRGRVGRSEAQAYAYFIVPSRARMSTEAHKRLSALTSYTSLGSGFRLALRDMEIRGVGNLLGKEQSGHITAIGYHLYIRILNESISELQGRRPVTEPILDLKLDAYFPSDYVVSAYERTALYKRLLNVESPYELDAIREEIVDRYGRFGREVKNVFLASNIRLKALEIKADEVVRRGDTYVFYRKGKIVKKMH